MHFYACPYCDPCEAAKLIKIKSEQKGCKHKKGLFKKDKKCAEENYKCKEVMKCKKCKSEFSLSDQFLKEQKRKIKDG